MVADPSRVFGPSGSGGGGTRGPRCPRPQTPTLSFPLPCAGDVRGVNPTKGVTTRVRAKPRSASHLVHHPTCPGHRSILASNEGRDDSGRSNLSGSPFGGGTSKRWATRSRHQQVRVTRQVQSQTEAAAARRPRRRGERKQSVQRRQEAASESAARSGVRNCSRSPLEMPRTGWPSRRGRPPHFRFLKRLLANKLIHFPISDSTLAKCHPVLGKSRGLLEVFFVPFRAAIWCAAACQRSLLFRPSPRRH